MARETSIDVSELRRFLDDTLGPSESFVVERDEHGRSNETVFVSMDDRDLVLRKPPAGATSESAHDVLREYHVMDALQDTPVPLPGTILKCEDEAVLGGPFYLMERLEGHVLRETEPGLFAHADDREHVGNELIDTLGRIHTVAYETVGLGTLGRPDGFTERQVDLWRNQLQWAFEHTDREAEIPELETVSRWLQENCPDTYPHTLVHGDYKPDNVMFGTDRPPQLIGVFDWEMATLGDPFTDLGWFLIHWHDSGDLDPILPEVNPEFLARDGYATRTELVERYERATGFEFEDDRFYRTLAAYKETAACEVFYARYLRGSENPFHAQMEEKVPELADRALRIVDGEEPL